MDKPVKMNPKVKKAPLKQQNKQYKKTTYKKGVIDFEG